MARGRKREAVTVSFHYIMRNIGSEYDKPDLVTISDDEFSSLCKTLGEIHPMDFSTKEKVDELIYASTVPVVSFDMVDKRTYFGKYMGVYTGHAYRNTAVGDIPADSASLRPFFFLLYLSKSGKLYIATQYLGQFGAYTALKTTIIRGFKDRKGLDVRSFRLEQENVENLQAKEIVVEVSKKSTSLSSKNRLSSRHMITFRKQSLDDDFEGRAKSRILPLFKLPKAKRLAKLSEILASEGLIDVSDEQIEDCNVIALVDGNRRNYYMLENGAFATHFHISVTLTADGHPSEHDTKKAMLALLESKIIKNKEDV